MGQSTAPRQGAAGTGADAAAAEGVAAGQAAVVASAGLGDAAVTIGDAGGLVGGGGLAAGKAATPGQAAVGGAGGDTVLVLVRAAQLAGVFFTDAVLGLAGAAERHAGTLIGNDRLANGQHTAPGQAAGDDRFTVFHAAVEGA